MFVCDAQRFSELHTQEGRSRLLAAALGARIVVEKET